MKEKKSKNTIQTTSQILSSIIKTVNPLFILPKSQYKEDPKPKYALSLFELRKYLEEQKEVNFEDYLIQYFLAQYGSRINVAAGLKWKQLHFLFDPNNKSITLKDIKTSSTKVKEISQECLTLFTEFYRVWKDRSIRQDEFVFRAGKTKEVWKRSKTLSARINRRIKESKSIIKNTAYIYSSHMIRKSVAMREYLSKLEEAKEAARIKIDHRKGTAAIKPYITI